jgi:molecular chaperone DnaK
VSIIVGIDLGTTYSATAIVRDGVPQIVPHGDERIVPSVVGLTPDNSLLVGTPARNQYALYPTRTIRSIKRQMGQETHTSLGERSYSPQEISALILRELKRGVEQQLGESVERAVITVPAYFSDAARQATREAGELAGLRVERIINEPTAAALAYGLDRQDQHQLVAVYDLGGGTFDVSIVELESGVVEVRASHGNTQLGGDDFDERLVDYLAELFQQEHGRDPRDDRRALARLTRAAEAAKIALSSQATTQVREEYLLADGARPLHLDVELRRETFEELIADLLDGTLESLDAALRDSKLRAEQLDHILLVGGSTRIPLVSHLIAAHTGIQPVIAVHPDEAVALGAAVQAAIIEGQPVDAILVDVTPHSLGIEVAEIEFGYFVPDRFSMIIPRNTTLPTTRSEIYSAIHHSQTSIEVKIYQGELPIASQNTLLGEFVFEDLRAATPGALPQVMVRFDFDLDGILHVSAQDRASKRQARTTVRAAHTRLTPAQVAEARGELDVLELGSWDQQDDWDDGTPEETALPEMSLETIGLLTRARRAAGEHPDQAELQAAIKRLEQAVRAGDAQALDSASEALLDLLYDLED